MSIYYDKISQMRRKYIKNYSPNFSTQKRNLNIIKFIIIHYTGMSSEIKAINRLTDVNSKVSCHYFIKKNGDIITMVPDKYIAWHAGKSHWDKYSSLNKHSIGIEIQNNGHGKNYRNFKLKQINSIIYICKNLQKKYKIKKKNVLAHSDISYDRKNDPGEKFPWISLAKKNICQWHNFKNNYLIKLRNVKITTKERKQFYSNLNKYGYYLKKGRINRRKLAIAFQRRFRNKLINGIVDKECFKISNNISRI